MTHRDKMNLWVSDLDRFVDQPEPINTNPKPEEELFCSKCKENQFNCDCKHNPSFASMKPELIDTIKH